jgi:hypothetical protein
MNNLYRVVLQIIFIQPEAEVHWLVNFLIIYIVTLYVCVYILALIANPPDSFWLTPIGFWLQCLL